MTPNTILAHPGTAAYLRRTLRTTGALAMLSLEGVRVIEDPDMPERLPEGYLGVAVPVFGPGVNARLMIVSDDRRMVLIHAAPTYFTFDGQNEAPSELLLPAGCN